VEEQKYKSIKYLHEDLQTTFAKLEELYASIENKDVKVLDVNNALFSVIYYYTFFEGEYYTVIL
jgi:hypothetical protein